MVVAAGDPPMTVQDELQALFIQMARMAHDPGDLRHGTPWPSGGKTPFLSQQGLDQGGFVWPNSAGI